MSNQENNQKETTGIDLTALLKQLVRCRKRIYKAVGISVLIGLVVGFSIPKEYEVKVTLSPESGLDDSGGLAGIASMFGLGNGTTLGEDALGVSMFPEIVKSTPFLLEMLETPVRTEDGEEMTLYDYLDTQRKPWWGYIFGLPGQAVKGVKWIFGSREEEDKNHPVDPFRLTPKQSGRVAMLKKLLEAETNKKTNMTTVSISLQDPVTSALAADSAVTKLQRYITDYRTRKAQQDCNYLERICSERKEEYMKAEEEYARFVDAKKNIVLQSVKAESDRLQKAASTAYQVYNQMDTQLQLARAKVQEAKPVFAVVEPATVPLRASSPKKIIILFVFAFLAFCAESAWILFGKEFWETFRGELKTSGRKSGN